MFVYETTEVTYEDGVACLEMPDESGSWRLVSVSTVQYIHYGDRPCGRGDSEEVVTLAFWEKMNG